MFKGIHWELCKKFRYDHTSKWYTHIPKLVQENEMHKLLCDWEINDHQISARQPDLVIVNIKKRTCRIVNFAVPTDHRVKLKKSEKRDKSPDLARELKKTMEHKSDCNTYCNSRTWNSHQRIGTGNGGIGNKSTSGDHQNYSIIEICQNTENSPGDLRRLVTQTPVENHQLTLVLKTLKWVK